MIPGLTCFVVPLGDPGVVRVESSTDTRCPATRVTGLHLSDVWVPGENLVGEVCGGARVWSARVRPGLYSRPFQQGERESTRNL